MPRLCILLIAGLDQSLLARTPNLTTLSSLPHRSTYQPSLPAVTSSVQATLTTGTPPSVHGIICNGLLTHNRPQLLPHLDLSSHSGARQEVSFWEQSNSLLQAPRFWHGLNKKTALLFCQNSMPSPDGHHPAAADIVLTPKPTHTPDGKTLTACWSNPADLYPTLTAILGPFPLHNYWSPMAGLPSSQWIIQSAAHVWSTYHPDLQIVYLPHLDFNLQRLGPSHPANIKDLQDLDAALAPLAALIRRSGGNLIALGDYGMSDVTTLGGVLPNLALRDAGLLTTRPDPQGKLLVDHATSRAFALVDHQIAHIYTKPEVHHEALRLLQKLPGVHVALTGKDIGAFHLDHPRSGNIILLAQPHAWFAHDWWHSDDEKPRWQFTVDIHSKPGYDPRELFFDPAKKCIAQDPHLIKGSHGLTSDPTQFPALLSDTPLPPHLTATTIAPWLQSLLSRQ